MKKMQTVGVFVAVFAFSALAVASASATLWLSNGRSLTVETGGTSHGTFVYHHESGIGSIQMTCSGLSEGTVGPGALGLGTLSTSLDGSEKDLVKCTLNSGFCSSPILHAKNLPSHSLLILNGTITENESLSATSTLLCPGFAEIECQKSGAKQTFVKNGPNGAEFEATKAGTETTCSDGGKSWATGKGEVLGFTVS